MNKAPLLRTPSASSPTLSPSDHLKLLVELLRPAGPELARRWLAALLVVPSDQREALVAEVERRAVAAHGRTPIAAQEADTVEPVESLVQIRGTPAQRGSFVEEVETTYAAVDMKPVRKATKRKRA